MSREMARPITLLHLSDLRFGYGHPCGRVAPPSVDDTVQAAATLLLADVGRLHDENGQVVRPDVLLLTGDLTHEARPSEFRDLFNFVDYLAQGLELSRDRVVVVPGNRDVSREACAAYFSSCTAEESEPRAPYWPKWRFFLRFFKDLYGDHPAIAFTESEPWTWWEIEDLKLSIAGLNSTFAESHRDEDHYGLVGERQLEWFARELEEARQREWLRIAVVHHDLRGEPTRPEERLQDREVLLQTLGERVNLFLQGSSWDAKSDRMIGAGANGGIPVFAAGSPELRPEAGPDPGTNVYQVLRIRRDQIHRWTRVCRAGRSPWANDPRGREVVPVQLADTSMTFYEPGEATLLEQRMLLDILGGDGPRRHREVDVQSTVSLLSNAPDFLSEVETVCRLRERAGAEVRRVRRGRPSREVLEVKVQEGPITRTYPVGALDRPVVWDDVLHFHDQVHAFYRERDSGVISRLIHSGEPAPEELIREAAARRIHLVSFGAFQEVMDFGPLLARQRSRLETDPVYFPEHYVPQRMRFQDGNRDTETDEALDQMLAWLAAPEGRFILALGDFGTGKSFLMRQLALRIAAEGKLIPVFIEMRNLEKSRSLDQLLGQHFAQERADDFSPARFRYMLAQGRIALLFDGFDELAMRVTYDRATDHFDTLLQASEGAAKVVVTSRRQHFVSDQQVKSAMGEEVDRIPGRRIATLLHFSEKQILSFLEHHCRGDKARAAKQFKLLQEVKLLGLAQTPRMLSFIAELPEAELEKARSGQEEISAPWLYKKLLDRWLGHETWRISPRGAQPGLNPEQRWEAVTELALHLWREHDHSLGLRELTRDVTLVLEALSKPLTEKERASAAFQVGSGTLLVRDENGNFSFIHQSVLEWLVARHAAERLREAQTPEALAVREASDLMLEFFATLAGKDKAVEWARLVISGDALPGAKQNAVRLLHLLEEDVKKQLDLSGRDLRGKDFSGQDMSEGDFSGADLSSARLVGTVLTAARLQNARLLGADLTRAQLEKADLTGANLSGARLFGASFVDARLQNAVLRRAKLVGSKLAPRALDSCDIYGAALQAPPEVPFVVEASFPVEAVAWCLRADQWELLAVAAGNLVQLWDVAAGRELRRSAGHTDRVLAVAFRPDGHLLASASADGTVRLWDVVTGEEALCLSGHTESVRGVAFAPDGRHLASVSADGTVRLWETMTGRETVRGQHGGPARCVTFQPDGAAFATGADDGTVRLWNAADGRELHPLVGHTGPVHALAFRLDGRYLASASEDRTARVRSLDGREICQLTHEGAVRTVAFGRDGRTLVTGGDDRVLRVWDLVARREARALAAHEGPVHAVALSVEDGFLASAGADRTVRIWERQTWQELRRFAGHRGGIWNLSFAQDGANLVSLSENGTIHTWTLQSGQTTRRRGRADWGRSASFSPDGTRLAAAPGGDALRLWNLQTGQEVHRYLGQHGRVYSVAFRRDGQILASGHADRTIWLWDVENGNEWARLFGHRAPVWSLAFSSDGQWLASGSEDCTVRIWRATKKGDVVQRFVAHRGTVGSVAFAPGNRQVASASTDGTVRLWDVTAGGAPVHTFAGHKGPVVAVAFAPGGGSLASVSLDGTVRLWSPAAGRELHRLQGHHGGVWAVAYSPDGRWLASGGEDNTVRLWDAESGTPLATLALLREGWAAFRPDGRYKMGGNPAGGFWHVLGLCRFEPGELEAAVPNLRLRPGEHLFDASATFA